MASRKSTTKPRGLERFRLLIMRGKIDGAPAVLTWDGRRFSGDGPAISRAKRAQVFIGLDAYRPPPNGPICPGSALWLARDEVFDGGEVEVEIDPPDAPLTPEGPEYPDGAPVVYESKGGEA